MKAPLTLRTSRWDTPSVAVQIKRYANRKLYNTETSRYITLGDISNLVRDGREIQVVDNETGHDISSLVLSRVLVDTERKGSSNPSDGSSSFVACDPSSVDAPDLAELLQRQLASLYALLRRYAGDVQGNLSGVVRWIQTGPEPGVGSPEDQLLTEKFERTIRLAVNDAVTLLDLPTRSEIQALQARIECLERALQRCDSST